MTGVQTCALPICIQETERVYQLGEIVDNGYNRFRIVLNGNYNPEAYKDSKLSFVINSKLSLAGEMSGLSISQITKESSIIRLTLQGYNRQKITDYLNQLLEEYLERNLEQKNIVSENTVLFIDEQLVGNPIYFPKKPRRQPCIKTDRQKLSYKSLRS